jgi:hypothetical protein
MSPLNQEVLVDAIGEHLGSLESYVNAIVLLAVASAWAGIRRSRQIEAFGTKIDRRYAFWVLAPLYLLGNATLLILLLRVGDLLQQLDGAHLIEGFSKLATHPWILNPFSFYGPSPTARFYSGEGHGLLIVVWWLCNASLYTLMDNKRSWIARVLIGVFLALGLGSMVAIQRVSTLLLVRLSVEDLDLYEAVLRTDFERTLGAAVGIVVGLLAFLGATLLQSRLGREN